jgi:hypothetical protein
MNSIKCNGSNARRAFAMMLILISLAIATILATAYLASRDNSAIIGANIMSGASAKAAAMATLKTGVAILETETNWRSNHTNGVVFANASLAGASVDLRFMDLITGDPPHSNTTEIAITATARVSGIQETITAHAHVPPPEKSPDVDFSEFGIFGTQKVTIKDTSLLGPWRTSPRAILGKPLKIGTTSTDAGAITVSDNGVALDGIAFHVPGASNMIVSNTGPRTVHLTSLPDTVLVPTPPSSGATLVSSPAPGSLSRSGGSATLAADRRYDEVTVRSSGVLTLDSMTLIVQDDLELDSGGCMVIRGNVTIVVFDDVTISNSCSIELETGATLEFFIGDSMSMSGGGITERDTGVVRDVSGSADWIDPSRIKIYGHQSRQSSWSITSGSVVKGELYAPTNVVSIDTASAVYGRVLAREVHLSNSGSVFYDHMLDSDNGYTVFDSVVYESNGMIHPAIKSLATLDEAQVATVKAIVRAANSTVSPPPPAGAPTPRTIKVTYEIVSLSSDVKNWENKASLLAAED